MECEPIAGGLGESHQWGPGTDPLVGVKAILKLKAFRLFSYKEGPKVKYLNKRKPPILAAWSADTWICQCRLWVEFKDLGFKSKSKNCNNSNADTAVKAADAPPPPLKIPGYATTQNGTFCKVYGVTHYSTFVIALLYEWVKRNSPNWDELLCYCNSMELGMEVGEISRSWLYWYT